MSETENNPVDFIEIVGEEDEKKEYEYDGNPTFIGRKLKKEEAQQGLELIGKTDDFDSYAYIKIKVNKMNLTNIDSIAEFKYLLFIDVSENNLLLENLQILTEMKYVILIQANDNYLQSLNLKKMEYLQVLLANKNYIKSCQGINQPLLNTLGLGNNRISEINFDHPIANLYTLDLSYNMITSCKGLYFEFLDTLYLAGNRITSLRGLEKLTNLTVLHLRSNPLQHLDNDELNLKKLTYLNIRSCKISELSEFRKLQAFEALETLIIINCPIVTELEEEEMLAIRAEIVARLHNIKRINKEEVTDIDREAALELITQWTMENEDEENDY